jgi:hypothetical protein
VADNGQSVGGSGGHYSTLLRRPDEIRIVLHHFFDLSEKYNRRVIETTLEARDAMTVRFGS